MLLPELHRENNSQSASPQPPPTRPEFKRFFNTKATLNSYPNMTTLNMLANGEAQQCSQY